MFSPNRRSLLRTGGALGVGWLAGCSGLNKGTSASYPRLIDLSATNLDDEPHTFHVLIEVNGETVYRDSKSVAAPKDELKAAVFTGYPTKPKPYEVYAWKDNKSKEDARTFDFAEYDSACLGLELQIGEYGSDSSNPHLAIYHTTNCQNVTDNGSR